MKIGTIFGRLLVCGAMATAAFALAAASGTLPAAVSESRGPGSRAREHHAPDGAKRGKIEELLRQQGFSEPYSLERERGVIEAEATGADGRRYEIYVDPEAREILEKDEED